MTDIDLTELPKPVLRVAVVAVDARWRVRATSAHGGDPIVDTVALRLSHEDGRRAYGTWVVDGDRVRWWVGGGTRPLRRLPTLRSLLDYVHGDA